VLTKIVCLGNELVCDDGVGIRVGRILRALTLPPDVTVEFRPNLSLDLLELIELGERVVLVDAMSIGRPAGSFVVVDGTRLESWASEAVLAHGLSIAEVVAIAKQLFRKEMLDTLYFVGIEGRCFDRYGLELSPEVLAALPFAVEAVLKIVHAEPLLFAEARAASERAMRSEPSIFDVLRTGW
jgi:hydrogenase maturation protease